MTCGTSIIAGNARVAQPRDQSLTVSGDQSPRHTGKRDDHILVEIWQFRARYEVQAEQVVAGRSL